MNEPSDTNPDVQNATVPQEPAAPAPETTPEQRARTALFATKPEGTAEPEAPPAPEAPAAAEPDTDAKVSRLYAQATESEAQMRVLKAANDKLYALSGS